MIAYLFDGTFEGLLTAIFEKYSLKHSEVRLFRECDYQFHFLETPVTITTDDEKAGRVWEGLGKRLGMAERHSFYTVFLSERAEAFQHMFHYASYLFDSPDPRNLDFGNEHVLAVSQFAKMVSRERHRMKAFVRFQKAEDGLFLAVIEPDFNVLPLISRHFAERFADQRWLIYDRRRKYGIYYDLKSISSVRMPEKVADGVVLASANASPSGDDTAFIRLWQEYFRSVNIRERLNLKLHLQHVPKRYWKYLPEKEYGITGE